MILKPIFSVFLTFLTDFRWQIPMSKRAHLTHPPKSGSEFGSIEMEPWSVQFPFCQERAFRASVIWAAPASLVIIGECVWACLAKFMLPLTRVRVGASIHSLLLLNSFSAHLLPIQTCFCYCLSRRCGRERSLSWNAGNSCQVLPMFAPPFSSILFLLLFLPRSSSS